MYILFFIPPNIFEKIFNIFLEALFWLGILTANTPVCPISPRGAVFCPTNKQKHPQANTKIINYIKIKEIFP